jgi:superfamily II helicase
MQEEKSKPLDYLVCVKAKGRIPALADSKIEKCCECKEDIIVSPSTFEARQRYGGKLICTECAAPKIRAKVNTIVTTQKQMEELQELLGEKFGS